MHSRCNPEVGPGQIGTRESSSLRVRYGYKKGSFILCRGVQFATWGFMRAISFKEVSVRNISAKTVSSYGLSISKNDIKNALSYKSGRPFEYFWCKNEISRGHLACHHL